MIPKLKRSTRNNLCVALALLATVSSLFYIIHRVRTSHHPREDQNVLIKHYVDGFIDQGNAAIGNSQSPQTPPPNEQRDNNPLVKKLIPSMPENVNSQIPSTTLPKTTFTVESYRQSLIDRIVSGETPYYKMYGVRGNSDDRIIDPNDEEWNSLFGDVDFMKHPPTPSETLASFDALSPEEQESQIAILNDPFLIPLPDFDSRVSSTVTKITETPYTDEVTGDTRWIRTIEYADGSGASIRPATDEEIERIIKNRK